MNRAETEARGPYVGALDQGTGGTRFVVFDRTGTPISEAFAAHDRQTGDPNRVEYDPLTLWGCATDSIRRGLAQADVGAEDLRALGISSQRQTVLLWEAESGTPVTNALSWRDRRTAPRVSELSPETRRLIRARTGLEPDAYFAAPTVEWLLNDDDLRSRAADGDVLVGTVDSWLLYNLTGRHATDVTNAAQTMLFDIHELAWDDELLELFGVPRAALPTVRPSSDPNGYGATDPNGVLNAAVPVTGVMGDQQAALLGHVACADGDAKVSYGTGNFFLQSTGTEPVAAEGSLLTTIWFQRAGEAPRYGLEGPVFDTGSILEWLRTVGLLDESGLDRLADTEPSESVDLVPGFGGLGAPFWVSNLDGAVFGLRRDTDQADFLRAAVEAIGFGTRAVVEAAEEATGVEHDRLFVDGGAIQDDGFARVQANLLGRDLVRSSVAQTAALGAGFAAGLAADVWESPESLDSHRPDGRTFRPSEDVDAVDDAYRCWREVLDTVTSSREISRK